MPYEIVAATGHRPDRLGGYKEDGNILLDQLKIAVRAEVDELYQQGAHVFISGMAQGWDTHFAEAVLELKEAHPDVQFVAALPFAGQGLRWPDSALLRWANILQKADRIFLVNLMRYMEFDDLRVLVDMETPRPNWSVNKMLDDRNKWMVEQADLMLACWNGSSGGTGNCIRDAHKHGLPIRNVHPITALSKMLTDGDLAEVI